MRLISAVSGVQVPASPPCKKQPADDSAGFFVSLRKQTVQWRKIHEFFPAAAVLTKKFHVTFPSPYGGQAIRQRKEILSHNMRC
jgi:hypothetical protein